VEEAGVKTGPQRKKGTPFRKEKRTQVQAQQTREKKLYLLRYKDWNAREKEGKNGLQPGKWERT